MTARRFLVVGGAHVDRRGHLSGPLAAGASNPGRWRQEAGGGAFNAARILARLGHAVRLIAPRGGDANGALVAEAAAAAGLEDTPVTFLDRETASYTAILDETGELVVGLADMALYEAFSPRQCDRRSFRDAIADADAVLVDANLPAATLRAIATRCREGRRPLSAIAISPAKAGRLVDSLPDLAIVFMNEKEAAVLAKRTPGNAACWPALLRENGLSAGVVTRGRHGAVAFNADGAWMQQAMAQARIVDVTGAGDALAAATLAALADQMPLAEAIRRGVSAATLSLASPQAVPAALDRQAVEALLPQAPEFMPLRKKGSSQMKNATTAPSAIDPSVMVAGDEVADALADGRPVVALESTIITHGMPSPGNLDTARAVETIIRENGAVPATIAVIDGVLHIGIDDAALARLGEARDVMKLSRADLAYAIAARKTGSTTVAATMIAAAAAGIHVFATGGIGGVHRGADTSFDISADLDELARTSVLVVSAGVKAILDIPKTLEVLETRGVPVVCFGTGRFPAFWSHDSGLPAPLRLDAPEDIANFQAARRRLGVGGGMLIANPIPEEAEIPHATMEEHISRALARAARQGVTGKAVTPFLLAQLLDITGGESLAANVALVKNNARLAALIAVALAGRGV